MAKLPWFERTFPNDTAVALWPHVVERLHGVPARIEEIVRGLSRDALTHRPSDGWSIQDHIGHLHDFEAPDGLHTRRVDQYLAGEETLIAADVTNKRTWEADHNAAEIGDLLGQFRAAREGLVARLEALCDDDFARTALHPRLKTPMRLIDMLVFWAEHDDHHVCKIRAISRGRS